MFAAIQAVAAVAAPILLVNGIFRVCVWFSGAFLAARRKDWFGTVVFAVQGSTSLITSLYISGKTSLPGGVNLVFSVAATPIAACIVAIYYMLTQRLDVQRRTTQELADEIVNVSNRINQMRRAEVKRIAYEEEARAVAAAEQAAQRRNSSNPL